MKKWVLSIVVLVAACGRDGAQGPQGLTGSAGAPGAKGDPGVGFTATASINSVNPRAAVLGKTVDVFISGFATNWTVGTQVNFGSDINVASIQVPSPTALIATIEVSDTAELGNRDILISANGKTATFKNGFEVVPPVSAEVLGNPGRGGVTLIRFTNNDPDDSLDDSFGATASAGAPLGYTGVRATVSPTAFAKIVRVTAKSADVLAYFDVDAVMGPRDVRFVNAVGKPQEQSVGFASLMTVGELEETQITGSATVTIASPYTSTTLSYTPSNTNPQLAWVSSNSGVGDPKIIQLPNAGKVLATDAGVTIGNSLGVHPLTTSDPLKFVVFDSSGASNYDFTFNVAAPASASETEPNETPETALPLTVLPVLVEGALAPTQNDADLYKVTISEANVGKRIHLRTQPNAGSSYNYADTKLEVLLPDGSSFAGPQNTNNVAAYHEEMTTARTPVAGDYIVRVTWGTGYYYGSSYVSYEMMVNVE